MEDLGFLERLAKDIENKANFWESKGPTRLESVKGDDFVVRVDGTEIATRFHSLATEWLNMVEQLRWSFFPDTCLSPHEIAFLKSLEVRWVSCLSESPWLEITDPMSGLLLVGESEWEPYMVPAGRYREVFHNAKGGSLIHTSRGLVMVPSGS